MAISQWAHTVAQFDAFPKVDADNQARSEKGGLLTILLACFLALLSLSEFSEYRTLHNNYRFIVDPTIETSMQINMDLTVAMPCPVLLVHVYDASGYRIHLTENLRLVPAQFSTNRADQEKTQDARYMQEVIKAATGKPYDEKIAAEMGACRIFGSIHANKVAANLHITSLGHGYQSHTHTDHKLLNFTHRIDQFSFGKQYPDLVNPLDNSVEITEAHFEVFQYILSIVPTTYIDSSKNVLLTNQYAVTDSHKAVSDHQAINIVPGIFFKYDIEPISVQITESRQSFTHFLVRLCGIIGGSVVTVGFIYRSIKFVLTGGKEDPNLYAPTHNLMRSV
ncbi:endoplasmic reticulum vesicle transporter-domain-containing protein [Zychaea mexicana]|uniref:endoplasmic reticulum vesicle transporter-domain-containing protein n=1 Tax=Zychaea mexicana TaxID=64656 RepID=UPI0022FEE815|nr:endoplasmic reticulum vesicle transporter-domain-containing protein [Zychaea mexicana]KAI9494790.1 endoplasmic reticulum vesicle transporter-domain-containing protein [Zychaea mexicana]